MRKFIYLLLFSVITSSAYAAPLVLKATDGTRPTSVTVMITNDYKLSPFKIDNVQVSSGLVTTTPLPTLIPYSTPGEGDYSVQPKPDQSYSVEVNGEHHFFMTVADDNLTGFEGQCLFQNEGKLSWYVEKCDASIIGSVETIYANVNHV